MEFIGTIIELGNSYGIIIQKRVLRASKLKKGDLVKVKFEKV